MTEIAQGFPSQAAAFVDGQGRLTVAGYRLLVSLFNRTGGPQGVDSVVVYTTAQTAQTMAAAATNDAVFYAADDGRINAVQAALQAALADTSGWLALVDDGRLAAVQAALFALPDPGAAALLFSGGR